MQDCDGAPIDDSDHVHRTLAQADTSQQSQRGANAPPSECEKVAPWTLYSKPSLHLLLRKGSLHNEGKLPRRYTTGSSEVLYSDHQGMTTLRCRS